MSEFNKHSDNIQLDEINVLINQITNIPNYNSELLAEAIKLQTDLNADEMKYSNDYMIDMLITLVIRFLENKNDNDYAEIVEVLSKNIYVVKDIFDDSINACMIHTEDKCKIFLNKGLYDFFEILAHITGTIVVKRNCKEYEENNKLLNEILQININKLKDVYYKNYISGDSYDALLDELIYINKEQKYKNGDELLIDVYIKTTNEVVETCIAFVLGHEIGHYYQYHTYTDDKKKSHDQELKADKYGLSFAMNYLFSYNIPKIHQCTGILLAQIGLLFYSHIDNESTSHPSIRKRIRNILNDFPKMALRQSNIEVLNILYDLSNELIKRDFIYVYWSELLEELNILSDNTKYDPETEEFVREYFSCLQENKISEAKRLYNELIIELWRKEKNKNIINCIKSEMVQIIKSDYSENVKTLIENFIHRMIERSNL